MKPDQKHTAKSNSLINKAILFFFSSLLLLCLFNGGNVLPTLAQCQRWVTTMSDLEAMSQPPIYTTGGGWVHGFKIATISKGTRVCVLEEREVGFFGSKQKWLRVKWESLEGWIYGQNVRSSQSNQFGPFPGFGVSAAIAQPLGGLSPQGIPPPAAPPLILFSFIAMVLGIVAKNTFDIFGKGQDFGLTLKAFAIRLIPPLMISPVIFLFFIRVADFQVRDYWGLCVLLLFAFQNGFFWQDLLARSGPPTKSTPTGG